jgi:hypothetical protein
MWRALHNEECHHFRSLRYDYNEDTVFQDIIHVVYQALATLLTGRKINIAGEI